MACQAMHMWSLSGLVAAFLDLAIAYLFLSASAIAFFTSKVLGVFGLSLPCPCDGLFFNTPFKEYCLSRLLVDFPTQKVSNVHASVKHKFPFDDSVWGRNSASVTKVLEIEGEASCSSASDVRTVGEELSVENYDLKGKGVTDHRPRSRLRHRRKGWRGRGVYSSVSSYDASLYNESVGWEPRRSTNNISIRAIAPPSEFGFGSPHSKSVNKGPTLMGVRCTNIQYSHYPDEISAGESLDNPQEVEILSGDEDVIRHLEQELDRERTARAALYSELEKERSAAASAADEAMAMILRLQEEKASIEMDARQYQRIIEEKSVYDAEEMDILKEILVRREREKLVLEKEVETYRQQMVSEGNEQSVPSGSEEARKVLGLMLDPDEDPLVMLHRLTGSTDKKAVENETSNQHQDDKTSFQDQGGLDEQPVEFPVCDSTGNTQDQEKEMFLFEENDSYFTPKAPEESEFLENSPLQEKELGWTEEVNLGPEQAETTTSKEQAKEEHMEDFQFYDVHVNDDPLCFSNEVSPSKRVDIPSSSFSEARGGNLDSSEGSPTKRDDVTTKSRRDSDMKKVIADITSGLPPIGPKLKPVLPNLRRSSMSAVDSEMLKIDWEVSKLRERLRVVREGREKLSSSVESREGENMQLKLLEDIARQVQEIRHLTQPGISGRQISLPLPTSKVQVSLSIKPILPSCLMCFEVGRVEVLGFLFRFCPKNDGARVFLQEFRESSKDDILHLENTSKEQDC